MKGFLYRVLSGWSLSVLGLAGPCTSTPPPLNYKQAGGRTGKATYDSANRALHFAEFQFRAPNFQQFIRIFLAHQP